MQTNPDKLWRVSEGRDQETGEWLNWLHLNRPALVDAKPILADSATNAISALDHVAAAIARAKGNGRLKNLYFPFAKDEDAFEKMCSKHEEVLGAEMVSVIRDVRQARVAELPHVAAAKEVSNSGKHWALSTASGKAAAISIIGEGENRIINLPADAFSGADEHEFHRGADRLPRGPNLVVIGLLVEGLEEGLPESANAILNCAFRFAEAVIDGVAAETT